MERRVSGIHKISIRGLKSNALMDLSPNDWGYEV
jgi:hypothetical protein